MHTIESVNMLSRPDHEFIDPFDIKLNEKAFDILKIKDRKKVSLRLGSESCYVRVRLTNSDPNSMQLSEKLRRKLHLPFSNVNLQITYSPSNQTLFIGPIIGILLTTYPNNDLPFGPLTNFCNELAEYCSRKNILFFAFSIEHFKNDHIEGLIFNKKQWIKESLPLPNVIYNRIPSRLTEKSKQAKSLFQSLLKKDIPYFNDHYLNKWEIYKILNNYDHIIPYLPETRLLNGKVTLKQFYHLYETCYIKPVHGSQGREIFQIQKNEKNILMKCSSFSGNNIQQFTNIDEVYTSIRERLKRKRFIIQEPIQLIKVGNSTVDFRYLCHKDSDNKWQITSSVARISKENNFVSNISKGGTIRKVSDILREHLNEFEVKQLTITLREIAIEVASLIDKETEGIYGELGLDLAVDINAKPWLIEVNTKPSKGYDSDQKSKIRPSTKAIIRYALSLTPFS